MTELLSLSRAARLAGVTRAELQKRIRRGEIETFEGQVALMDLLRVYPALSLEKTGMLEEVERIKAAAVPKLSSVDTRLPNPEVLLARLRSLAAALTRQVAIIDAQNALLLELRAQLDRPEAASPAALADLVAWLDERRAGIAATPAGPAHTLLLIKDTVLRVMSAHVKLLPSGHEFLVEGADSILDAAVKSGVRIGYGCASGNCGECKARVISGETSKVREHDYVLSEREKQMGYVLTCCNTAVTDVVLEAAEARTPQDLPQQSIRAQVRKLEPQREDLLLLHVQTPRTQTLRYMAGQRARLTLETGAEAELPIASCPCNGRNLQFLVRRGADDFSNDVFTRVAPRQLIGIHGPQGSFVLREEAHEPAVFIAVGDGIAPIKSLIEHGISIDSIEAFHLYWSVADAGGHHQERWCRALKDALDNFSFTPLINAAPADLLALLQADLDNPAGLRYYIAGPAGAVHAIAETLTNAGIPAARIATEVVQAADHSEGSVTLSR